MSEIRKVTALLDQEWGDVDDLAHAVIQEVMDMVEARDQYAVVMVDGILGTFAFGPFDTEGKARKAIGTSIVSAGPEPAKGYVCKLLKGTS